MECALPRRPHGSVSQEEESDAELGRAWSKSFLRAPAVLGSRPIPTMLARTCCGNVGCARQAGGRIAGIASWQLGEWVS